MTWAAALPVVLGGALLASFLWPPLPEYGMAGLTLFCVAGFVLGSLLRRDGLSLAVWAGSGWRQAVWILTALFVGLLWGRAVTSLAPAFSLLQAGYYSLPFLVALGLSLTPGLRRGGLRPAIWFAGGVLGFLAIGALVQSVVQMLGQPVNLPNYMQTNRAAWPLSDSNHLGAVMAAGVLMALSALWATSGRDRRLSGGLALVCFAGLLATGSRGAMLGLIVAGIFLALFLVPRGALRWGAMRGPVYGLLAVMAGFALLQPLTSFVPFRLFLILVDFENATGSRFVFWPAIWGLVLERPWLGTGTGTFPLVYPQVATSAHIMGGYAAHNDPLQLALEAGLPAALLFYALAFSILGGTLAFCRRVADATARAPVLGAAAVMLALTVHAHVEFMLGVLPLMMILGGALGVWLSFSFSGLSDPEQGEETEPHWTVRGILVVAVLVLCGGSGAQLASVSAVSAAREALAAGDVNGFAWRLELAKTLSFDLNPDPYRMAAQFHLGLLQAGNPGGTTSPARVVGLISEVIVRQPFSAQAREMTGDLAVLAGSSPRAAYQEALHFEPRSATVRLKLARVYEDENDIAAASVLLEATLLWPEAALRGDLPGLLDFAAGFFTRQDRPALALQATLRRGALLHRGSVSGAPVDWGVE